MRVKPGVEFKGLCAEILYALLIADEVYNDNDLYCVLTAGMDGKHMVDSLHYKGRAADLRTRQASKEIISMIAAELKARLGRDFDVVVEADHIHVEYDPKGER